MTYLWIALGGVFGANARYLISAWAARKWVGQFHYGTFFVNITGSFAYGILSTLLALHYSDNRGLTLFITTGFLGAYTTFSTFSHESLDLIQKGEWPEAIKYVGGSALLGITGALAGISLMLWIG